MSDLQPFFVMLFNGGFASDFGPNLDKMSIDGHHIHLPFLTKAEDIIYTLDGGIRKAPGAAKINSVQLDSGAVIKGVYDAWFGSTQKRIIHCSTKIYKEDVDGTFDSLFTGLTSGSVPSYCMMDGFLIASNTTEVPKSWDGTTAQDLAGSPPQFSFAVEHKNRIFAAGVSAAPSRLYYSALLNPEDWSGNGSGIIDISPGDGDEITGLASHNDVLFVFKGPNKGSIHRIEGTSPADFSRALHVKGIGACAHNTIFPFSNDIGFMWSDGSIHSLAAVSNYGNFQMVALSRPIQTYIRENLNFSRVRHFWAANHPDEGMVLFTVAIGGSTNNNQTLVMDYRFKDIRWALWPSFASGSICSALDSGARTILAGGNDGYVRKYFQSTRVIDSGTAISMAVDTPFMSFIDPKTIKTLVDLSLQFKPHNDSDITVRWQRNANAVQSTTINQVASLDIDFLTRFAEITTGDEFRDIQFGIRHASPNHDCEIHGLGVTIKIDSESTQNLQNTGVFMLLDATSGAGATTPDSSAASITGDIDLRVRISPEEPSWLYVGHKYLIDKWSGAGASGGAYNFTLSNSGYLRMGWYNSAGTEFGETSTVIVTAYEAQWVRVTLDVNNGAAGYDVKFYTSINGTSWTQLGATVTGAGTTNIRDTAATLKIGTDGGVDGLPGKVFNAQVYSGIAGTLVAEFDPTDTVPLSSGSSFTSASTGETWTLAGTAVIV